MDHPPPLNCSRKFSIVIQHICAVKVLDFLYQKRSVPQIVRKRRLLSGLSPGPRWGVYDAPTDSLWEGTVVKVVL